MADIDKYSEISGRELETKLKDFASQIGVDFKRLSENSRQFNYRDESA